MPHRRNPYPAESRQHIVELVRAGWTLEELALNSAAPRRQSLCRQIAPRISFDVDAVREQFKDSLGPVPLWRNHW